MPLTSLYLVSLAPSTSIAAFIPHLTASLPPSAPQPLLIARPLRWIIDPWISSPSAADTAALEALTSSRWDLLVIFPAVADLPEAVLRDVRASYTLRVGISSKIIQGFHEKNAKLLHPSSVPALTGSLDKPQTSSTSKDLHLTDEISRWFKTPAAPKTAPSMLNFLTFNPGKHESYKAYGQAFATSVGIRRGGLAKIVGSVPKEGDGHVWDEVALAHYPTVWHFADMLAGEDYQAANAKHRVDALRGTAILCCNELDPEVLKGLEAAKGKDKAKI